MPTVQITKPGKDAKVSPIEEVHGRGDRAKMNIRCRNSICTIR